MHKFQLRVFSSVGENITPSLGFRDNGPIAIKATELYETDGG